MRYKYIFISLLFISNAAIAQSVKFASSRVKNARGTVLLFDSSKNTNTANWFRKNGFDVAVMDVATINTAAVNAYLSFARGLQQSTRFDVAGVGAGASLAAKLVQRLDSTQQPAHLLLISPKGMGETLPGTVLQAIMPPVVPKTLLFSNAKSEYFKTWIGYDGTAVSDSNTAGLLTAYVKGGERLVSSITNPAAVAVEGDSPERHAEKVELVQKQQFDLVLLGNSITNNFEKPEYQPVFQQFFVPRRALNLGFSGYRTENLIWNIQNGELEGQRPKVLVLEIGTNNIDEKNYPTRHTARQLAGGIKAIVDIVKQKLPDTKIILLRAFPGCYGGPNPTSHRAILERASDIVSSFADNKQVFYSDVNHVFLNMDGSINQEMMPDWLHPSPAGAKAWAEAMEPLLSQLMGDSSRATRTVDNTAIVPVTKLEEDSYNWWHRHAEVLRIKDSVNPEIVLIGNSITHFWGGLPKLVNKDGTSREPNGPTAWKRLFDGLRVLNLGFGWDRTQNVLWRLDHGELDNLHPRLVIIDIGTNNTSHTANARMNTAAEITEGIAAVIVRVRSKVPHARIFVMNIFPREQDPQHPRRLLINEINISLNAFAADHGIAVIDISPKMLRPDGTFLPGMMLDFTHPSDKGYEVWGDAIKGLVDGE